MPRGIRVSLNRGNSTWGTTWSSEGQLQFYWRRGEEAGSPGQGLCPCGTLTHAPAGGPNRLVRRSER